MEQGENESGSFQPPPPAPSFSSEEEDDEPVCSPVRAPPTCSSPWEDDYDLTASQAPFVDTYSQSPSPTPLRLTPSTSSPTPFTTAQRFTPSPPPFAAPTGGVAPRPKPGQVAVGAEALVASAEEQKRALMRKVAQLTKVVVHLTARNDESEGRYERLRAGFDEKMQTITQDVVLKVGAYRKQLTKLIDTEKLKEEAFCHKKAEKISELEVVRSNILGRQQSVVEQGQGQLRRSASELRNLQTELQASLGQFRQVLDQSREELELQDLKLRDQHKAEVEAVSSEHRQSLDELSAANAQEIRSLTSTHEKALLHSSRLHDSELTTLKLQALQMRREKAHRLEQDFLEERRSLEHLILHTTYELEQARREVTDSTSSIATTEQQIGGMQAALDEMRQRVEVAQAEASKAREEATLKEAGVAELQAEVTVLQVRQRTAGISNAPAPPHSALPAAGQHNRSAQVASRSRPAGAGVPEELREATAGAMQLEAELGQSNVTLAHLDDELTEKEQQVELLEVEIEEEQLRNQQIQARILEREAAA